MTFTFQTVRGTPEKGQFARLDFGDTVCTEYWSQEMSCFCQGPAYEAQQLQTGIITEQKVYVQVI